MGWSGGTNVAVEMTFSIQRTIESIEARKTLYRRLIISLQNCDWDCEYEVQGIDPAMDEVLKEMDLFTQDEL